MFTVADLVRFLDDFAPQALAEPWDNVGLLIGRDEKPVERMMTCLTVTPAVVAEAIEKRIDLLVTHHPILFRAVKRLTSQTSEGRMLLDLAKAEIAVYSPHTAFDSTYRGINHRLADGLKLQDPRPMIPAVDERKGTGRIGTLAEPITLVELAERTKQTLKIAGLHVVGPSDQQVSKIGIACGAAGELIPIAAASGCQVLVTGEVRFHGCLEAEALGLSLILAGHYASERFAVEELAGYIAAHYASMYVVVSQREQDPLRWV